MNKSSEYLKYYLGRLYVIEFRNKMNQQEKLTEIINLIRLGWKVEGGRLIIPNKLRKNIQPDYGLNEAIQLQLILEDKKNRNSVWLCDKHGGYGFQSDCKKCKND